MSDRNSNLGDRPSEPDQRESTQRHPATAQGDGLLGRPALQYRHGPGSALDCCRGSQRQFIHQPVGAGGGLLLLPHGAGHQRAVLPLPRRRRIVCVVEGGIWRFSRIRRRMDLLDLHGFYFPGLLLASVSMSAYVLGGKGVELAQNRAYLEIGSYLMLAVAVGLNIIGLNIGKWLQNAGGVATYLPLLILTSVAGVMWMRSGSVTHFTWANMMPTWNWDTVNFWSQIAFAFTGLELVSAMSGEIRDPRRTLP